MGPFKQIHGINLGPLSGSGSIDVSEQFSEIRFPTVRLHDCPYTCWDTVDIPCIFPLFHLDHQEPRNYKFGRTDTYVQSILDCGSRIVYRLGTSIQHHPGLQQDTHPPEDYGKWADVCCNVIRHYNEGWGDGFHHDIRYWEIWNEAEIEGSKQWAGTYEQFTDFFITAAKRIKSQCPDIMIGGPAFAGVTEKKVASFLARLREKSCPLDFLSWHLYAQRPTELCAKAQMVRELLDEYGFPKAENHLNEWNLVPFGRDWKKMRSDPRVAKQFFEHMHGPAGGVFTSTALVAFQDAPLDMTNYYSAGNLRFSMFDSSGVPHKPFYAFRAFKLLLDESPMRVEVAGSDPDKSLAVLSGVSDDGRSINLLLNNFSSDNPDWSIRVEGLETPSPQVTSLVLDENRDLEQDADEATGFDGHILRASVPRETVRLVRMRRRTNG